MKLTASRLRENIYQILDQVIQTGKPIEIQRGGSVLVILPKEKSSQKLERLRKQKFSDENSDGFEHIDWTKEWKGRKA